jgi:NAD(P) transhydrogenase subunit alpha
MIEPINLLIILLTIFVLAIFIGFEVITKVPPTLHTPLMSGSNAISGITVIGALLAAGAGQSLLTTILGTLAVIVATINVVGGFMVTNRMLEMFRKKGEDTESPTMQRMREMLPSSEDINKATERVRSMLPNRKN